MIQRIKQPVYKDNRGAFTPIELSGNWVQTNISINNKVGVFRGMHYQRAPKEQTKVVAVLQGKIVDFVLDIRPNSSTFGKLEYYELEVGDALIVPKGYAHGFITLQSNSIVNYLVDELYSPQDEGCIFWETVPALRELIDGYTKELQCQLTISDKDLQGTTLQQAI